MQKTIYFIGLCGLIYLTSCAPKIVGIKSGNSLTEEDDFVKLRPQYTYQRESFEGNSKREDIVLGFDSTAQRQDITFALNTLLDFVPVVSEGRYKRKRFEGYRIQIYRGRSRELASKARQKSYELFPNLVPYFLYSSPTYRVRVGDFLDQYEYQAIYKRLKKEFPDAIVVPDVVNIIIDNTRYFDNR